jgi:hypothetical protein
MDQSLASLHPVNYNCPVCMNSNKLPNRAGKFFLINETECQCNGCQTIFQKKRFYKPYVLQAINVKLEQPTL